MIVYADARNMPFADSSFQTVVTSPPYWALRSYGNSPAEIGHGPLDQYIADITKVSSEVARVLNDDGIYWLNISDTASGSGGAGGDYNRGGSKAGLPKYRQGDSGIAPMQWCLVPQRIALALQDQGWLVRSWITWDKGRIRPESAAHTRRPGISSETILMLVKQRQYRFYADRLEEKGDVWHFPPYKGRRGHLAPFPPDIPYRCITLSTDPGEAVLDPFVGSGTTTFVAREIGRVGVGLDLYRFKQT